MRANCSPASIRLSGIKQQAGGSHDYCCLASPFAGGLPPHRTCRSARLEPEYFSKKRRPDLVWSTTADRIDHSHTASRAILFGPFRLLPAQRLLLRNSEPVRLGSRAFDILTALLDRPGELVTKNELISRVWPHIYVEEGSLKVQVSLLRRVLGDGKADVRYVATDPGRATDLFRR